jgi:hypothetical protein
MYFIINIKIMDVIAKESKKVFKRGISEGYILILNDPNTCG